MAATHDYAALEIRVAALEASSKGRAPVAAGPVHDVEQDLICEIETALKQHNDWWLVAAGARYFNDHCVVGRLLTPEKKRSTMTFKITRKHITVGPYGGKDAEIYETQDWLRRAIWPDTNA